METPCCNQVESICPVDSIEVPGGLCMQNGTSALSKMQDYQGQELPNQFNTTKNMLKTTSFSLHWNIDDNQKQFCCYTEKERKDVPASPDSKEVFNPFIFGVQGHQGLYPEPVSACSKCVSLIRELGLQDIGDCNFTQY